MYLYIFTFKYTEVAWVGVYIYLECKQRVYVCMCIFTYMSPRLDVGVYIGRVGTQSLHVGVSVVAHVHTESQMGANVCMYSRIYTQNLHTCVCIY